MMQFKYLVVLLAMLVGTRAICDLEVIEDLLDFSDNEEESSDEKPSRIKEDASTSEGMKPGSTQDHQNSTSITDAKPTGKQQNKVLRRRYIIRDVPSENNQKSFPTGRKLHLSHLEGQAEPIFVHSSPESQFWERYTNSPLRSYNHYLSGVAEGSNYGESDAPNYYQSGFNSQHEFPVQNTHHFKIYRTPEEFGLLQRKSVPQGLYNPEHKQGNYFIFQGENMRQPTPLGLRENINPFTSNKEIYVQQPSGLPHHREPIITTSTENTPNMEGPVAAESPCIPFEQLPIVKEHRLYEVTKLNPGDFSETRNIQEQFHTSFSGKPCDFSKIRKNYQTKVENMKGGKAKKKGNIYKFDGTYFPIVVNNPDIIVDDHGHRIVPMREKNPVNYPYYTEYTERPMGMDQNYQSTKFDQKEEPINEMYYNKQQQKIETPTIKQPGSSMHYSSSEMSSFSKGPNYSVHSASSQMSSVNGKPSYSNPMGQLPSVNIFNRFNEETGDDVDTKLNEHPKVDHESIPEESHEGHDLEHHFQQLPVNETPTNFKEGNFGTTEQGHSMENCGQDGCSQQSVTAEESTGIPESSTTAA